MRSFVPTTRLWRKSAECFVQCSFRAAAARDQFLNCPVCTAFKQTYSDSRGITIVSSQLIPTGHSYLIVVLTQQYFLLLFFLASNLRVPSSLTSCQVILIHVVNVFHHFSVTFSSITLGYSIVNVVIYLVHQENKSGSFRTPQSGHISTSGGRSSRGPPSTFPLRLFSLNVLY